jgi:hypothetical protein
MDLIDMSKYAPSNYGYHYALNIIDLFSKQLISVPIVNKTGATIASTLNTIFTKYTAIGMPKILQSDNGGEFKNKEVTDVLKTFGVVQIFSKSYTPQTQGAIERANGTLKKMIARHFVQANTENWVDVLADLISNYNTSVHRITGATPNALHAGPSPQVVSKAQKGIQAQATRFTANEGGRFRRGDYVRIALKRLVGQKSIVNWSSDVYKVIKVIKPAKNAAYAVERYLVNGKTYASQELLPSAPPLPPPLTVGALNPSASLANLPLLPTKS